MYSRTKGHDEDDKGNNDDIFPEEDSQVFMTSYDEEHNDLDDFDPEDENLYDVEDCSNDVDVDTFTPSQAFLTNTIDDKEDYVHNKTELEYEEIDNDDTLMLDPEKATKNIELVTD